MTKKERNDEQGSSVLSALPARSAGDLKSLVAVLTVLAQESHERMTLRQALFYLAVAYHKAMGETVSVPRLREIYEPLGRSIEKSKDQLLEPTKRHPDALGWLTQEVDEDDRRLRYLSLSEEGADIAGALVEALRQNG